MQEVATLPSPQHKFANLGACTAPPSLTAGAAWRIPPGFTVRGTELEEKKALVSPGEGEWRSKHDGQFFPPITCYPTHGKRLVQCGDCRILRMCSVSPSPQLCRCPPERRCAPTHGRRLHSEWSEPSPPGGTARLEIGTPRRRHPLSSGPTSVWRQPYLSAGLRGRQRAAQSFWSSGFRSTYMRNALRGHSNTKAGSASSEGSACRFTTWCRKGVVGTLGTYPGLGLKTTWE